MYVTFSGKIQQSVGKRNFFANVALPFASTKDAAFQLRHQTHVAFWSYTRFFNTHSQYTKLRNQPIIKAFARVENEFSVYYRITWQLGLHRH